MGAGATAKVIRFPGAFHLPADAPVMASPTERERAIERAYLEMIARITAAHTREIRRLKRQLNAARKRR